VFISVVAFGQGDQSSVTLTPPSPPNFGQAVALAATVTPGATGAVSFYDGVTLLGSAPVSNHQATLTTVMLPSGIRSLRAYYSGDATYAPSTSTSVPLTVVPGPSLGLRRSVKLPSSPTGSAIAVGDFNGDGKQDYVASNGSAVIIFLGNGDGTFQTGASYVTPSSPSAIAVGDFDGDGKMDLAVACYLSTNNISVRLGAGDGTFGSATIYSAASNPNGIAVGDFNRDGKSDLVVAAVAATSHIARDRRRRFRHRS
jgi:hypothetical protein